MGRRVVGRRVGGRVERGGEVSVKGNKERGGGGIKRRLSPSSLFIPFFLLYFLCLFLW